MERFKRGCKLANSTAPYHEYQPQNRPNYLVGLTVYIELISQARYLDMKVIDIHTYTRVSGLEKSYEYPQAIESE